MFAKYIFCVGSEYFVDYFFSLLNLKYSAYASVDVWTRY